MTINRSNVQAIKVAPQFAEAAILGNFIAESFCQRQLSEQSVRELLNILRNYYQVRGLTSRDLKMLLDNTSFESQFEYPAMILGLAFADYMQKQLPNKFIQANNNRLFGLNVELMQPLAQLFDCKIQHYSEAKESAESGVDELELVCHNTINAAAVNGLNLELISSKSVNLQNPEAPWDADYHFYRILPRPVADLMQVKENTTLPLEPFDSKAMKAFVHETLLKINQLPQDDNEEKQAASGATTMAKATVSPYGSTSRPAQPVAPLIINPERASSLVPAAPQDLAMTRTSGQSWQAFIQQEIVHQGLGASIYQDSASAPLNLPALSAKDETQRKVVYTLWDKKVVIVDIATQKAWDEKLAQSLQDEDQEEILPQRPAR